MTKTTGHSGPMKVSSVELKTRLGHYLRTVERSGVPVEICVRNHPVAILMPHGAGGAGAPSGSVDEEVGRMLALKQSGLAVESAPVRGAPPKFEPVVADDGRTDVDTVASMRAGRSW